MELESDFRHPPVRATVRSLEAHFRSDVATVLAPLRNPHHESRVDAEVRRDATPASVLIPIVPREAKLTLLLTKRHEAISYPGHFCFPGGRAEPSDASPEGTALRETEEEIALARERVRILGRLGDYVTHSGFRIAPFVGFAEPPLSLRAREGEVEEIVEIPLALALDSSSYQLRPAGDGSSRAVYVLEHGATRVTGPTVSILMGFYEELLKTHG